jgi:oxygen-dependent protoporphyrinogen oxidase
VVVIGAGLTGLSVAHRLLRAGRDVVVLEASERVGGQIDTERQGELVVEHGAEGFVARSRVMAELAAELGLTEALLDQLTTDTYTLSGDAFELLPKGEAAKRLGFQVPDDELGRGIRSFAAGMAQVIDALSQRLAESVKLLMPALAVNARADGLEVATAEGVEPASAVVFATSAEAAAALLAPLVPELAAELARAQVISSVSVNLTYDLAQFGRDPGGSGLLLPGHFAARGIRACSFVHRKFARRAPQGIALVRVFFRPSEEVLGTWDDARFARAAAEAVGEVLLARGTPLRQFVSRWPRALPVYTPEYRAGVCEVARALSARSLELAGSAFWGAGIDAAVSSGVVAADRLLGRVSP